jgi:Protein of unknown function (DUF2585)
MADRTIPRLRLVPALAISLAIIAAAAGILLLMGRIPICGCGYIKPWHGHANDAETSQHLTDWYTYSHVLHGVIFYLLLWAVLRGRLSVAARLVIATLIEVGWEIFENSAFIIERYRTQTVARDYAGDSVINSVGDMLATVVGYLIAARLPTWIAVTLFILTEVVMLYLLRDNLILNIIMLVYPLEVIRQWQAGSG